MPEPRSPNPDPHVIRLNRAWEYRLLDAGQAQALKRRRQPLPPAEGRVDLPLGDLPEVLAAGGHLLLTRHFNRPSNLNAQQEVRLFIRPAAMIGGVWLNSARLAIGAEEAAGASLSIGGLLQRYNRLDILIAAAPWLTEADVRLVIDEPAGQPGASAS